MEINTNNIFILTIGVGIITYSIPFIWNAYRAVTEARKKIPNDEIDRVLVDKTYGKRLIYFRYFIKYPAGVAVFFLLFVFPIFDFGSVIIYIISIFFYFMFLPEIFNGIIGNTSLSKEGLVELIRLEKDFNNIKKIFKELWSKDDDIIEKEFDISPKDVFVIFSEKIDFLFSQQKYVDIENLLDDYIEFSPKRDILFLIIHEKVFPKILKWHYEVWRKHRRIGYERGKKNRIVLDGLLKKLNILISKTLERSLEESFTFYFFEHLKEHFNKYKNKKIGENKNTHYYLRSLPIYETFFEKLLSSPESYLITKEHFPKEWKITALNWKREEQSVRIWWSKFSNWAYVRINAPEKYDEKLDMAANCLFPEINPSTWSTILTFVSRSWSGSRMGSLIDCNRNFGLVISNLPTSFVSGENMQEDFMKHIEKLDENTIELACLLLEPYFQDIDKHINELKELEQEYRTDKRKNSYRIEILKIFKAIKIQMDKE